MFHGLTYTLVLTEPRPIMIDLCKNFLKRLFYCLFKTIINFDSLKQVKKISIETELYALGSLTPQFR